MIGLPLVFGADDSNIYHHGSQSDFAFVVIETPTFFSIVSHHRQDVLNVALRNLPFQTINIKT